MVVTGLFAETELAADILLDPEARRSLIKILWRKNAL
jgi:hypothetical protein